ncbi:MAG TPA: sensor histidine kinase [Lachnospiraceae bacterium]|nr:sensor histidine kinase [Lachnospiraceae bacterium]
MVVIPVIVINTFTTTFYKKLLIKNASDLVFQEQQSVANILDSELKNYSRMLAAIVYNSDSAVLDQMTALHRASDSSARFDLTSDMDQRIQLIMTTSDKIDAVLFFFKDAGYYYYINQLKVDIKEVKQLPWYKRALEYHDKVATGNLVPGITADAAGRYTLMFAVHPSIGTLRNDVEMVLLTAYTTVFEEKKSIENTKKLGAMLIINQNGEIMYSEDKALEGENALDVSYLRHAMNQTKGYYTYDINHKPAMISTFKMNDTGWRIINLVDQSTIVDKVNRLVMLNVVIMLMAIFFFILFTLSFFKGLIKPINQLISAMKQVEKQNFEIQLDLHGNHEIRRLSKSFNKMVYQIGQLIFDNQKKEQERSKAEIAALQAQINPHFISNTLNSIRFMAMVAKFESIQTMAEMLMNILTTSFRSSGHFNTVEGELELIKSYIYIMQIRYGNNFTVRYEVDSKLLNRQVLKLILQPFVENAIIHGISEKEGQGDLLISIYVQEEQLVIEIWDNGVGMTQEQMDTIFSLEQSPTLDQSHIGICNVKQRIVLNHGATYGIQMESDVGHYTKVRLMLPLIDAQLKESDIEKAIEVT